MKSRPTLHVVHCTEQEADDDSTGVNQSQVDKAKLTTDKHIETRYGIGTIRNLSTSCKTLLNIVKHQEKVVSVEECGPDVLKIIFSLDNIKIYMSRPSLVEISDTTQMRFDDSEVVTFY